MKKIYILLLLSIIFLKSFAQAPTTGLVAYYPFNSDAQDAVGTNHGAVNGATLTTNRNGIANSAFYFDGNDWIKILQSPQFEFNDYTLSVWFKPQTNTLGLFLANPGATQSDDYWTLGIYGNQIEAYVYSNRWLRGNNINIDQWQNVIFTKSGTIGKIYINGVLTNTFNDLANIISYSTPRSILIGGDDDQGNDGNADTHWYNGSLDDIRIYNRALSDAEVQQLYQAEVPPIDISTGLVAHYKMDGNAQDASGYNNHGIEQGGVNFTTATDRFGVAGKAAGFDGVDDYISASFPNQNLITNQYSISSWININDFYNQWFPILEKPTSSNAGSFHLSYENATPNIICGILGISGTNTTTQRLNKGQWYNLVITYNGTSKKFFLNGVLLNTLPNSGTVTLTNTPLNIGRDSPGQVEFANGKIDDIRIYNRALTDTEVQALYQAEAPPIDITTGLVAHYKMDGNAQDASGNGNHGTQQGGVNFTTATDRFGGAGKAAGFDGVDDYIDIGDKIQDNVFTINSWVRITDYPSINQENYVIISKIDNNPPNQFKDFEFRIRYDKKASISLPNIGASTINNLNINQYHMITTTYDGVTIKIFINGILEKSNPISSPYIKSNTPLRIGNRYKQLIGTSNPPPYFKGYLDDIRIYNRALTDAEVLALYASENSGVALTTALRFGGGQTILNVGTNYNVTATIKNNGSSSWVGDVYLKAKGGTPTLISSNNVISAGGSYNISSTFIPQTTQIGTGVTMELLTKQGTNDFVRVATVNGTVNPVVVNIEAINPNPVIKIPFIRLNQSEVSPGGTVQIVGGNFEPNTNVTIGSYPNTTGAIYPNPSVNADGSILTTFTIPNTFTDRYLTIYGRDTKSNNPGASLIVNQPQEVAVLKITKPYKENETINITPNGTV